jgi:phospholipase/lecithinase/hemolysin
LFKFTVLGRRTEVDHLEEIVQKLFDDGLDELYTKAGARNFLLIDVPPQHRSPAGEISTYALFSTYYTHYCISSTRKQALNASAVLSTRYTTWNELLHYHVKNFASDSGNVSVFLFSAHQVVSAVLDDPEEFGFAEDDVSEQGGAIWMDEMHMTSEVHAIIAERIEVALRAVDA